MRRTTIILDEELYRQVKRKAVDHGQPMRLLIENALKAYLGIEKSVTKKAPRFGVYRASVKGTLSRRDLYGYLGDKV